MIETVPTKGHPLHMDDFLIGKLLFDSQGQNGAYFVNITAMSWSYLVDPIFPDHISVFKLKPDFGDITKNMV